MGRMSDINRADELKAAKTIYDLHLRKTRAEKIAAYALAVAVGGGLRVNRSSTRAFIKPFGTPENFWYETKVLAIATTPNTPKEESATALIAVVISATLGFRDLVVPTGVNNVSNLAKKIQFAKVRCTERGTAGTAAISRMTGIPYTKYTSNTLSNPFGRGNSTQIANDTEPEAKTVIRNLLMTGNPAGRSVSFVAQGFVGNVAVGSP